MATGFIFSVHATHMKHKEVISMKITWYGHSAFHISTNQGTRIIIDPYKFGAFNNALAYGPIKDRADIVITSHDHEDHNDTKDIQGKYVLINKAGDYEIKDLKIKAISTFHDPSEGKERGHNLISAIKADNMVLAHLGDLGHSLDTALLKEIGKVDILLLPVGGLFTIDAAVATEVMNAIKPIITIPMHYKTEKCGFPIDPVEDFTKGKKNVRMLNAFDVSIERETLPKEAEIIVLEHSL
jgi:L-ascorbate metabolism protein UlaG (beta-lactamase superfamily)